MALLDFLGQTDETSITTMPEFEDADLLGFYGDRDCPGHPSTSQGFLELHPVILGEPQRSNRLVI